MSTKRPLYRHKPLQPYLHDNNSDRLRLQATLDCALLPRSHQMKLHWQIDDKDVVRVKALIAGQAGSALIRARQERNLNEFGFPVRLTTTALGDDNYYRFISDGIQTLCERSNVLPCIFDAAVFASRDSVAWTDDNMTF